MRRLGVAPLSDATFIWGHSQGGQASAFAGQIAPRYAPELRIAGVIDGSPAAELGMLADEMQAATGRSPLTGIAEMIVRAWSAAYPDAPPSSALTPRAVERIGVLNRECIDGVLTTFLLRPAPDYIKGGALSRPPWATLIATNTRGRSPRAPVLVFQGGVDSLIKPAFTEAFVRRMCAAGDTVRLNVYAGKGHLSVIAPSMPDTLTRMSARLTGQPPPSSC